MKKPFFILLLVLSGLVRGNIQAQNREIRFETGDFQKALDSAKEQGRWVFMDCYTSWCGPCKLLAKNVFTLDSVADFFNTQFVNFSIDMEKGEGKALQEKYKIEAYPTLLLLDAEGQEMFRSVGGCSAGELMFRFRAALDPRNTAPAMAKRFAEGERDTDFIRQYWNVLQKSRQFEELEKSTIIYFRGMDILQICQEPYWTLFDQYVTMDNPLHHILVDSVSTFKALKGAGQIDKKMDKEYDLAIMGRIPNVGHTEAQVKQYADDLEKIGFQDSVRLFYLRSYLKVARLKVEKKYDEYLNLLENELLPSFSPEEWGRVIVSLLMLADGTLEQRKRGNDILMKEARRSIESKGALSDYENQMFGFIQFRLSGKTVNHE